MKQILNQISVVIPLYNKQSHILATIESVVNQTVSPLEIIVVDDGSSDSGAKLVLGQINTNEQYQNVRLIQQINGGVSKARNTGIAESKTIFVAMLDADDLWEAHFLEEITHLIEQFPEAGAFATSYQKVINKTEYIDPKIRFPQQIETPTILPCYFEICAKGDLPFIASSICINKTIFKSGSWFPEGETMGEDQDLWARLSLTSVIAYSPKVLAYYHLDSDNRACNVNYPKTECGFSKRLFNAVNNGDIELKRRNHVLAYTATHLVHLARLNISIGEFQVAKALLADVRCNHLRVKKWICRVKIFIGTVKFSI